MRVKRILSISAFILLIIEVLFLILQVFFLPLIPTNTLPNRFHIRSIGVDWVQLDSIDQRSRGFINFANPTTDADVVHGVRLKMNLEFVSDSAKSDSKSGSLPGRDGAVDPIQSITWQSTNPNQPMIAIEIASYRLLDMTSVEDHAGETAAMFASHPLHPIPHLDSITRWLNTGCCFPNTRDGRLAFYFWLDSSSVDLLDKSNAGLKISFKSGKTLSAQLPSLGSSGSSQPAADTLN